MTLSGLKLEDLDVLRGRDRQGQDQPDQGELRVTGSVPRQSAPEDVRFVGPFDPAELVQWADTYGHPEEWAKRAQAAHMRAEQLEEKLAATQQDAHRECDHYRKALEDIRDKAAVLAEHAYPEDVMSARWVQDAANKALGGTSK